MQPNAWRRFVVTKPIHWKPSPQRILCSAHFFDDCFVKKNWDFLMRYGTRRILRPRAVSTIHVPHQHQLTHHENVPAAFAGFLQGLWTMTTAFSSFSLVKSTHSSQLSSAQCSLAPLTASMPKASMVHSAKRKHEVSQVSNSIIDSL